MLYVRMGREDDRWWRECRACERWFFRLVVPLFLAAIVVGWLWSRAHAGAICADDHGNHWLPMANGRCLGQGKLLTLPKFEGEPAWTVQHGAQLGSTTVRHYRCHRGVGDVVVFDPIEESADEPPVIFLHCVNCTCEGEK